MSNRFQVKFIENEHRWVLIDTVKNREIGCNGRESEDQLLVRDWAWVPTELNALDDEIMRLKNS